MSVPISNEIRDKIIKHKKNNVKEEEIAKGLIISKSTVTKIWSRYRKTGSYMTSPRTQGRKSCVDEVTMNKVEKKIKETPNITLLELIKEFNLTISEGALSEKLKKLGYSYKKTHISSKKRQEREAFKKVISKINAENLVTLDESSINLAFIRLYRRAKKSERISEGIIDVRF